MKKKKKEQISEELYKQSKMMIVAFTVLGVFMICAVLLSATISKGTYSAKDYCVGMPSIDNQHTCEMQGYTWRTDGVTCTYTSIFDCENANIANLSKCGLDDNNCPVVIGTKTCQEFSRIFYPTCPSDKYCSPQKNEYGCYVAEGTIGEECNSGKGRWTKNGCENKVYAAFYTWDGQSSLGSCEVPYGLDNCAANNVCAAWSTSPQRYNGGTLTANITSGGNYYCVGGYSVYENCCKDNNGVVQNYNYMYDCEAHGYNWVCYNPTPTPTASSSPSPSPTATPTIKPSTSPTTTPTKTPTPTSSNSSCYVCTLNGKTQHVIATSKTEAASAATSLNGVTANNCEATSMTACTKVEVQNCYECTSDGKQTKHVYAYSADEAKIESKYDKCDIVSKDKCNTDVNPKTGMLGIIMAWSIGLFTIAYAFWYFNKSLKTEK